MGVWLNRSFAYGGSVLEKIKQYIYVISIAIIPMVFGSFLFVGVLEKYKNTESLNTTILDSYKSLRVKRSECHKIHNNLFLSYYAYSGSLKIMGAEMKRLIGSKGASLPKEFEIFVTSNIEAQTEQRKEIEKLKKSKEDCYSDLYISYEELAILLNRISEYETIAEKQSSNLNRFNSSIDEAKDKLKRISPDDIMNVFRDGIKKAMLSNTEKWLLAMEELSEFQLAIAKIEEEKFQIDLEVFSKLRRMYLVDIRSKLNKGFVSYLFQ